MGEAELKITSEDKPAGNDVIGNEINLVEPGFNSGWAIVQRLMYYNLIQKLTRTLTHACF